MSMLLFNANVVQIKNSIPKEAHKEFDRRVKYVLNILDQETMSREALALIAADVATYTNRDI